MTAKLSIHAAFHSSELSSLGLPVEIRTPDLRPVTTARVGETVLVEPGEYLLVLRLPAGISATETVEVPPGNETTHATIKLESALESPRENEEVQRFVRGVGQAIGPAVAAVRTIVENLPDETRTELIAKARDIGTQVLTRVATAGAGPLLSALSDLGLKGVTTDAVIALARSAGMRGTAAEADQHFRVRGFDRNPMLGAARQVPMGFEHSQPRVRADGWIELSLAPHVAFLQLRQAGEPTLNVMVPTHAPANEGAALVIQRCSPTVFMWSLHPANVMADALLTYFQRGDVSAAKVMADSLERPSSTDDKTSTAESLLRDKMASPIGAAVGAYTLLRVGGLDRLHDWTRNLFTLFPSLPDAASICGEHFARQARHAEALDALLALADRGLPIFTDGLSYAIDRLGLYTTVKESPLDPAKVAKAGELLQRLRGVANTVDFGRQMVSYAAPKAGAKNDPGDVLIDTLLPA